MTDNQVILCHMGLVHFIAIGERISSGVTDKFMGLMVLIYVQSSLFIGTNNYELMSSGVLSDSGCLLVDFVCLFGCFAFFR